MRRPVLAGLVAACAAVPARAHETGTPYDHFELATGDMTVLVVWVLTAVTIGALALAIAEKVRAGEDK